MRFFFFFLRRKPSQTEEELITISPHRGKSHKPFLASFLFYNRKKSHSTPKLSFLNQLKNKEEKKFLNSDSPCCSESVTYPLRESTFYINTSSFPGPLKVLRMFYFLSCVVSTWVWGFFFFFQPSVYIYVHNFLGLLMNSVQVGQEPRFENTCYIWLSYMLFEVESWILSWILSLQMSWILSLQKRLKS